MADGRALCQVDGPSMHTCDRITACFGLYYCSVSIVCLPDMSVRVVQRFNMLQVLSSTTKPVVGDAGQTFERLFAHGASESLRFNNPVQVFERNSLKQNTAPCAEVLSNV